MNTDKCGKRKWGKSKCGTSKYGSHISKSGKYLGKYRKY